MFSARHKRSNDSGHDDDDEEDEAATDDEELYSDLYISFGGNVKKYQGGKVRRLSCCACSRCPSISRNNGSAILIHGSVLLRASSGVIQQCHSCLAVSFTELQI